MATTANQNKSVVVIPDRPDSNRPQWIRLLRAHWLVPVGLILGLIIGEGTASDSRPQNEIASLNTTISGLRKSNAELQNRNSALSGQVADLAANLKATAPLPRLTGKTRMDVQTIIDQHGWSVLFKEKESHRKAGTVLSQSLEPGTLMSLGRSVTVVVAKPFPPKMPNLVGKNRSDAQAVADKHGWTFTVTKKVSSSTPGTIIGQTPAIGTYMRGSAHFTIVIAKAAPKKSEGGSSNCDPNYTGACLNPNASDYDCAGGSGNGPLYVAGPVYVVGYDHYGLDSDGDGVACE
jgi:PASTA domain-containing protein